MLVAMGWWPRADNLLTAMWNKAFLRPGHAFGVLSFGFLCFLPVFRQALLLKGRVLGWFMPGQLKADQHGFPHREVDLYKQIARRPKGMLFVGMRAERRSVLPGWKYRPRVADRCRQPQVVSAPRHRPAAIDDFVRRAPLEGS